MYFKVYDCIVWVSLAVGLFFNKWRSKFRHLGILVVLADSIDLRFELWQICPQYVFPDVEEIVVQHLQSQSKQVASKTTCNEANGQSVVPEFDKDCDKHEHILNHNDYFHQYQLPKVQSFDMLPVVLSTGGVLIDFVGKVDVGNSIEEVVKQLFETEFFPNNLIKHSLEKCDKKDVECNEGHQWPKGSWTKNVGKQGEANIPTHNLDKCMR